MAEGGEQEQKKRKRSGPRSRTSDYLGVTRYKRTGRWEAHIWDSSDPSSKKGRQLHLGSFPSAEPAALAYDRAAVKMRGDTASLNFPATNYKEDPFLKRYGSLPKQSYILKLRQWAQSIEGSGDEAEQPGGSSDNAGAGQDAANVPHSSPGHRRSSQPLLDPSQSQGRGQGVGQMRGVQQGEVAPTRRSSRMAQKFSGGASTARVYEPPRPPTYFGSVALAAHPFSTASTLALQFSDASARLFETCLEMPLGDRSHHEHDGGECTTPLGHSARSPFLPGGHSMQQSEYLLPAQQHLPDLLEQEARAWQGHDLGRLSGGWAADDSASWAVHAGSPLPADPRPAQQAAQGSPSAALAQYTARFAPVESMLRRVMFRPGSDRSPTLQRPPLSPGASVRVPRAQQGYRNEELQQRGRSAGQVVLPHLPMHFPDVHQQDDGILVDQPRVFTSAAQMLTDILPSTLITIPASASAGGQHTHSRPHSASPTTPAATANQPLHRALFRPSDSPARDEPPPPAETYLDTRIGSNSSPQMLMPQWAWLEPAADTAEPRLRPRPMGRSHSVPTHLPALHTVGIPHITGPPSLLPVARQQGSSHSQAGAGVQLGRAPGPAAGIVQMEDWAREPEPGQEEPSLAAAQERPGAAGRARPSASAPDLAAESDLVQEQLLGRARDEVLLISAGSAHLATGTGLLAAVTQEHSPWAAPGTEP